MQGSTQNKKRKNPLSQEDTYKQEDVDMNGDTTSVDSSQRKIVKPKKKVQKEDTNVIVEEDGEEIELGSE